MPAAPEPTISARASESASGPVSGRDSRPAAAAAIPRRWSRLRQHWRLWLTAAAVLLFAIALWRPGLHWSVRTGSTVVVIDITQSMNVMDMLWDGQPLSRLEYTRALLKRSIRELDCGHQLGVGVFTERKTMVLIAPLEVCAHYAALDDVIGTVDWRMAWAADSHLYYGVYSALTEIGSHWPGSSLALFTDGHQAPALFAGFEPRFERTPQTPAGFLFGVGGSEPQPVPHLDADGRTTGYWTAAEAAAFPPSGPRPTMSVADMERAKAEGQNIRNYAQRPKGSEKDHLSGRRDDTLQTLAEMTGLRADVRPSDAAAVVAALKSLPGDHLARRRLDLHNGFVGLGALALLASLVPTPRRRHPAPSPPLLPPMRRARSDTRSQGDPDLTTRSTSP